MELIEVPADVFGTFFDIARTRSSQISAATSPFEPSQGAHYFLDTASIGQAGYVVRETGELTNVFSLLRGQGSELVEHALSKGAEYLDCFDGYLPGFYARHGFVEISREPNWVDGDPDVVYMRKG